MEKEFYEEQLETLNQKIETTEAYLKHLKTQKNGVLKHLSGQQTVPFPDKGFITTRFGEPK